MSHSIIIHTNNKEELSILEELAKKMGFSAQILSIDTKEELCLAQAIAQNDPAESLQLTEAIAYYNTLSKAE
jgi:predicted kinase